MAGRLFEDFLAPLVLGGEVRPGRLIGPRSALEMDAGCLVANTDLLVRLGLGRTRIARRLAPVDSFEVPTPQECWLGAALHDLVQAAHPALDTALRRHAPARILSLVDATLARVSAPVSVGEALARHTWFARLFEMARIDTIVSWWVGSRTFMGEPPPTRLVAWPHFRRVHLERVPRTVTDLPNAGAAVDPKAFAGSLTRFLAKTPLTDLATCHRVAPAFQWGEETLGLVGTSGGRTLAMRAFARAPKSDVDASLGRATRALVTAREWRGAAMACVILAERALADHEGSGGKVDPLTLSEEANDDASYAQCLGALVACAQLRAQTTGHGDADRHELLARLMPVVNSRMARRLEAELLTTSLRQP